MSRSNKKWFCIIAGIAVCLAVSGPARGAWLEEQMLLASDGAVEDKFGGSVSISGDWAIVGAYEDDDKGGDSGAAYMFWWNGTEWFQQQKLLASDGTAGNSFGWSVSISGDWAIVGMGGILPGSNSGAAYIFKWDGTSWIQQQKLVASGGHDSDSFGNSVSIHGDYAIVGAPGEDDGEDVSAWAYIFKWNDPNWVQQQKLVASDGERDDWFGLSVSIHGDYAIVGAPGEGTIGRPHLPFAGAAYLFKRNGTSWAQQQKLANSPRNSHSFLGWSVSISDGCAIAGAPFENNGLYEETGAAYVFKQDGAIWFQQQMLLASDGAEDDTFGWSVSISGIYAIVGASAQPPSPGDPDDEDFSSAYLFKSNGTSWVQQQKFLASDGVDDDDFFGNSVCVNDYVAIVGAYGNDPGGKSEAGSAYVFRPPDGDGDGLLDEWETDGIHIDCDGIKDLDLPTMGADPDHKDLFVEVDFLTGQTFPAAAQTMVIEAFNDAPVSNPDSVDGITLHIMPDETNLPSTGIWPTDSEGWAPAFDTLKDDHFGTVAEQADSDALAAKKMAFRYCIVADKITDDSLGTAELPGNDFFLTLGEFGKSPTDEELAGLFMHEFGHNLGLRHGGDDNINGKPNYISVMNYALAAPLRFSTNFWKLDYSRVKLDTLTESSLNETLGIRENGAACPLYQDVRMIFGVYVGSERYLRSAWVNGTAVDWDGNGNDDDINATQDINFLGSSAPFAGVGQPSFPQTLNGHNDWANLRYAIGTTGDFADYAHNTVPQDKITEEILTWLNENAPSSCVPADFDCDDDVDMVDFAILGLGWQSMQGETNWNSLLDISDPKDNVIDILDLYVFANYWLAEL